jgi:hypothetical protein
LGHVEDLGPIEVWSPIEE